MFLSIYFVLNIAFISFAEMRKPAWRNGLARWTSNPKVVGSNPTVGVLQKNVFVQENGLKYAAFKIRR